MLLRLTSSYLYRKVNCICNILFSFCLNTTTRKLKIHESFFKLNVPPRHVIPKNFSAVILVSNCESKSQREKVITDLRRVQVPVDIFGNCGAPSPYGQYDGTSGIKLDRLIATKAHSHNNPRILGETHGASRPDVSVLPSI